MRSISGFGQKYTWNADSWMTNWGGEDSALEPSALLVSFTTSSSCSSSQLLLLHPSPSWRSTEKTCQVAAYLLTALMQRVKRLCDRLAKDLTLSALCLYLYIWSEKQRWEMLYMWIQVWSYTLKALDFPILPLTLALTALDIWLRWF